MIKKIIPQPIPTIPLTQIKFDELVADKKRLTDERVEVMKRLQIARDMGDLSENGAYHYAKFELGNIGRQLRQINYLLDNGKVTAASHGSNVGFGSVVKLKNPKGKISTYQIVSEYESDPMHGRVSTTSPLGQELMGKKIGEAVTVTAPVGKIEYVIESVV